MLMPVSTNGGQIKTSRLGDPDALVPADAWLIDESDGDLTACLHELDESVTYIDLTPAWGRQSSRQARHTANRCNVQAAYRLRAGRSRHGLQSLIRRHRRQVSRLLQHPDLVTYTEAAYTGEAIWEELFYTLQLWLLARFCVSVCLFNAWVEESATLWRALIERLMGSAHERLRLPPRRSRPAVQPRAPAATELAFV